jgi:hypothetical protein
MSEKITTLSIMKVQYNTYRKDWMGFKITKENPLTYHHIKKEEDGGPRTIENGALLTLLSHKILHTIELYDKDMYIRLNEIFKRINKSKTEPSKEDYCEIISILEQFEKKHVKVLTKRIQVKKYNYEALKKVSTGKYSLYSPTNIRMAMMEGINPVIPRNRKRRKSKVKKKVRKK